MKDRFEKWGRRFSVIRKVGNGNYAVSDRGDVMNIRTDCILSTSSGRVRVEGKNIRISKLVAEAFIPNPDLLDYVFHKDGNPENNCVDNLEWVGEQERRSRMRARAFSRGWGRVGTPVRCLDSDYNVVKVYRSMLDAANALGLTQPGISRAVKNMTRCGGFYWTQAMPSEVDDK